MNVSSDDEPFADDDSSWEEGKMPPRRFQDDVPRGQQSSNNEEPPKRAGKWSHPGPKMDIVKLGHTYPQIVPMSWKTPNYPAPIRYSEKRPVPPPEPRQREIPPEAHSFGPQFEPIIRKLSAIFDPTMIPSTGIDELKMPPAKPINKELQEPPEESITNEPPAELIKQVKEYVSSIPKPMPLSIPKPMPFSIPKPTTPSTPKPMPPAYKFAENYVDEEGTPVGASSSTPEPPANVAKENYEVSEAPSPPTDTSPQTKDVATDEAQIENDKKQSAVPSDKKVAEHPDSSNIIPSEVVVTTTKTRTLAPVTKAKIAPPRPGGHRIREARFRDPDGHRYNVDYTRPPQSYVEAHPSRRRQHRREEAMAAYVKAEGLELEGGYATTPENDGKTGSGATSVTGSEPKGTRLQNVNIPEQQVVIVKDRRPRMEPSTKPTPKLPLAVSRGRLVPSREVAGIEPQNQMYPGRRIAVDSPGLKPGDELIIFEEQQEESLKSQPTLVASDVIQAPQQEVNEDVKQVEDQEGEQKDPPSVQSDLKNYDSENLPLKQQPATAESVEEPEEPASKGLDHDTDKEPLDKGKEEYKAQFMKYIAQEVGALQDKLAQLGMTKRPTKNTPTIQPPVQERLLQQLELERQREQLEYDALMKQVDAVLMQATATVATDPDDVMGLDAPAAEIESLKGTTNLDLYEMEHPLTHGRDQQDARSQVTGQQELPKAAPRVHSEAYDRILRKWLSARAEQPRSHQTLDRILRKWLKKNRESFPSDETPYDESPTVTSATEVSYSDLIERLQEVENGVFPVTKGGIYERRQKPEKDPEYIPFRRHEPKRVVVPANTRDSAQIQGLPRSSPTKVYDLPTRAQSSASSMPPYRRTIDAILQAEPRVHSRKSVGEQQYAVASSFDEKEKGPRALKSTVSLGGGDRWRQVLTASNSLLL